MTSEYTQDRIEEALKLAKGNKTCAAQYITSWALDDAKLLQALTKPHLGGIIAYNIERVASGRAQQQQQQQQQAAPKAAPRTQSPPAKNIGFGAELLGAISAGDAPVFGLEGDAAPSGAPTQASQRHINAIHQLARRSSKTKG